MIGICYMHIKILENPKLFEKGLSMVSVERRKKVIKLKNDIPARLSLAAGILLQFAMEKNGQGHRRDEIRHHIHGKPYLENTDFSFSLSHSGEYAVCVYGDIPLGADIQKVKEEMPKHTKRILSEEEAAFLNSLEEGEKTKFFYDIWARKESLIKWDGRGLLLPLYKISCVKENKIKPHLDFEGKKIYFHVLDTPEYAFSICSEKEVKINEITEITTKILTEY